MHHSPWNESVHVSCSWAKGHSSSLEDLKSHYQAITASKSIRFLQHCHSATSFIHLSTQQGLFFFSLSHYYIALYCPTAKILLPFSSQAISHVHPTVCAKGDMSKEMGLQLNVSFPVITRLLQYVTCSSVWLLRKHACIYWFFSSS